MTELGDLYEIEIKASIQSVLPNTELETHLSALPVLETTPKFIKYTSVNGALIIFSCRELLVLVWNIWRYQHV